MQCVVHLVLYLLKWEEVERYVLFFLKVTDWLKHKYER